MSFGIVHLDINEKLIVSDELWLEFVFVHIVEGGLMDQIDVCEGLGVDLVIGFV